MLKRIQSGIAEARKRASQRNNKAKSGFTLMELLVVVVILGFLVGMLAPRLAGIIDDQVIDTICDTNNKGARQYIAIFHQREGKLPNKVTNLVNRTGAGVYEIPSTSNGNDEDGAETFAEDFTARNGTTIHYLSTGEVQELYEMGITQILNFNADPKPSAAIAGRADEVVIFNRDGEVSMDNGITFTDVATTPVAVAMVSAGAADAASQISIEVNSTDYARGNPYWIGRILLGLGAQNSLVSKGYVANSALCPGGMQDAANITWNNYVMVVPRLAATVERMGDWENASVTITAAVENASTFIATEADANGVQETFKIEAQGVAFFDANCPEGHKWPDNENDNWVVTAATQEDGTVIAVP